LNRVNRVLVIFLALNALLFWGVWEVLQTEWFAGIVAKKLTKNITSQLGVQVKFERLDFNLYPPASIIKQVKLRQENESRNGIQSIEASQVGIYFNIWDFFSNKITVDKIRIYDAEIVIDSVIGIANKKDRKKFKAEEIMKSLLNYQVARKWVNENLAIKIDEVLLENTFLIIEDKEIDIHKLSLTLLKDSIGLKGLIENINLESKILKNNRTGRHTSCELDLSLNNEGININAIDIKDGLLKIGIKGEARKIDKKIELDLQTEFVGLTRDVFEFLNIAKLTKKKQGLINIDISLKGEMKNPNIKFKLTSEKLLLDWSILDKITVTGEVKNKVLIVKDLLAKKDKGELTLINPVELYSFNSNNFIANSLDVKIKNFHTNHALYIINDNLSVLKGELTGKVLITWDKKDLSFFPRKGFRVNKFRLTNGDERQNILHNKGFNISGGSFILSNHRDLYLDTTIEMKNSLIPVKGYIKKDQIDLFTVDNTIDLEDVGPISVTPLYGKGRINLRVIGPPGKIKFLFDTDLKDFSVVGLNLGNIKGGVSLDLTSLKLGLIGIEGDYLGNIYKGGGYLDFSKARTIDLKINIQKAEYQSTLNMINPVVKKIRRYFPEISMTYNSNLTITGTMGQGGLVVAGELQARDIRYKTEDINSLKLKYSITNSEFDIPSLKINKERGVFEGNILYNFNSKQLEFDADLIALKLGGLSFYRALNLGLRGDIHGEFSGRGKIDDFSTRMQLKLLNSYIDDVKVGESNITIYNNDLDFFINGDFLNKEIVLKSMLGLGKNKKRTKLDIEIKSQNVKKLLGVISSHNIKDDDLLGSINATLNADFLLDDYKDLSLKAVIHELDLERGDSTLHINKTNNKLLIKKGKIVNFDLRAEGNGNALEFNGYGSLASKFKIENKLLIDASLAELISDKIEDSNGKVSGRAMLVNEKNDLQSFFQVTGDKVHFKLKAVPGTFNATDFTFVQDGKDLLIQHFQTFYGKGKVSATGGINFKMPVPTVNVEFEMENSTIPLFEKSYLVVSGKGKISGEKLPYFGYGNFSIYHGEILDSLDSFTKQKLNTREYSRYIPKSFKKQEYQFFSYDISVDLARPIKLQNNLAELYFSGGVRAIGKDLSPQLTGDINIIQGTSKFVFKGQEFNLTEGIISFDKQTQSGKINPDINFIGVSDINAYEVKVDISGASDNVKINLSSDPVLSQADILSLLTIGVTTDVSKNLDDTDRQSITTIGVGSLLVDQLKLNEGLTSSMGLQLSVLPEISEDETAFLRGKSAVTDSQATKLKTSTKIKIKKKVTKDVNISVSSTIGGTLEQRQEMNINYNINKKFSIEGVYEVNSSDEDSNETPDSIGADIKYKWKF
jgi:translocation and assembly module TamB